MESEYVDIEVTDSEDTVLCQALMLYIQTLNNSHPLILSKNVSIAVRLLARIRKL